MSCGFPILRENDEKCTKALINLWGDMLPGRATFQILAKSVLDNNKLTDNKLLLSGLSFTCMYLSIAICDDTFHINISPLILADAM